ncbi:MAG: beta-galactosidase small subunit [Prolixibacteraceae bacterium]|jgi:beta-galactosidase|nr:beta-galactosidase small subunit [Prolixibacteraceae bacterium]
MKKLDSLKIEILVSTSDSIVIATTANIDSVNAVYQNNYTIYTDGTMKVMAQLQIKQADTPELPRFGMKMVMPGSMNQVQWYGRGPHENYIDRNSSALVGLYSGSVMDQYVPYIYPQENGNKTDVRWLTLTDEKGKGFKISGLQPLNMNAHHYLENDFDERVLHTPDVPFTNLVEVCIDHLQMGVGGDNSWGARPHDQYQLKEKLYRYEYIIEPLLPE